jgi:hypothetical protein
VQPPDFNEEAPECLFRDAVCLIALQLLGQLAPLLLRSAANVQLVRVLLSRLDDEQEHVWLDIFVQELIQVTVYLNPVVN